MTHDLVGPTTPHRELSRTGTVALVLAPEPEVPRPAEVVVLPPRFVHHSTRLAGIQGAIWMTEYSGLTISGGSSYVGYYQGLASAWGASAYSAAPNATINVRAVSRSVGKRTDQPVPRRWVSDSICMRIPEFHGLKQ